MSIVVKNIDKKGQMVDLYVKDAVLYYAKIHDPVKIHKKSPTSKNPSENHYQVDVFISEEDAIELREQVRVNKQLFEVGVDKKTKGDRSIKYKEDSFELAKGLHGFSATCNELNKKGEPNQFVVVDGETKKPWAREGKVGNGSKATIKFFGWRNDEGELNIEMRVVFVTEAVEYVSGPRKIVDDELGISFEMEEVEKSSGETYDEVPFDTEDDSDY